MKKITCAVLSLLMIFTLSSCSIVISSSHNGESEPPVDTVQTESEQQSTENEDTATDTDDDLNTDTDPIDTENTDSTDTDREEESSSLENVNNGVLKEASAKNMRLPENLKLLEGGDATEENNSINIMATVVLYSLDGDVVNWATENDFIYVITAGNNRLVVIDTENMAPVYNAPLAGVPAEMNIIGDKIYVSLPDLCRIDVFSKSDCTKESSLYFDHEVSSFCIDGDYIYYSEHDQWCKVFRKNLVTNQVVTVQNGTHNTFYYPKLLLNKEDRILYVGECGTSGSAIYYYDADTLALRSTFEKDNYGITNHTREIFHVGDAIFWGNYCLSDTNARELIGRYGTASYGSVVFASEELVSTYEGLFLTDTYECVIDYFDAGFEFEYILVTESYNVFFRQRTADKNIILGVNFELQQPDHKQIGPEKQFSGPFS